ncbi:MAG TPA: hypothetical protein VK917_07960 [Ilumatobacter sp.]|nr:hypothetical protein [Ilumatobacter sp.]
MTDHLTPHDTDAADDETFEQLARAAGAELRRPAPPDGMQRLRAARRRQQVTRSVVAGGAAVLLVGMGTFVALRGTDDPGDLATQPDPTIPEPAPTTIPSAPAPTTLPEPSPTTIPSTPPTLPANREVVENWLGQQRAEGRDLVYRAAGDGTDALALVAQTPDGTDAAGIVVLPDGRGGSMPAEVIEGLWSTMRVYGLGDSVAVISHVFDGASTAPAPVELHLLDPATGEWTNGPELGLDRELGQGLHVLSVDGSLLVGRSVWIETDGNTAVPSPARAGVIVRPDLTVDQVATPPDGVQMEWTSGFGRWALNFGLEPGALDYTPFTQPWKLDVETNEWSEVPLPPWLDCEPDATCQWFTPHEFGDRFLEVVTDRGVLKRAPDGTVGIYDPASDSWTGVEDPPFALAMPATAVIDDRVVVAPVRAPYTEEEQDDFGQIGVLDLETGRWEVERFEVADDDTRWEIRADASGVIAQPVPIDPVETLDVVRAHTLDAGSFDWRPATPTDAERWLAG